MAKSALPFYGALVTLWPLLLVQGKWTRWTTPKLPEAEGERVKGRDVENPLRILIAGDSAAAGVGVDKQEDALLGQLAASSKDFDARIQLIAETGRNAQEVLALLKESSIEPFDIVVLSVGVNDVTGMTSVKRWQNDIEALYDWAKSHRSCVQVLFSELPPMHAFLALPQPLRWVLGQRAKLLQDRLEEWALTRVDCQVLKSDFPIEADYLASDGFHPGSKAYTVWAAAVRRAIQSLQ